MKKIILVFMAVMSLSLGACSAKTNEQAGEPEKSSFPIEITFDKDTYTSDDEKAVLTVSNSTGTDIQILLAPRLYRENGDGWEAVDCNAGFCGVMDPLGESIETELPFEWFGKLTPGHYKAEYTISDTEINGETIIQISGEFDITE